MKRVQSTIFVLLGLAVGQADAVDYSAPVTESIWSYTGSRVVCRLEHPIHHYGRAVFEQRSGEGVRFELSVDPLKPAIQTAQLQAVPPAWMHDVQAVNLHTVQNKQPMHRVSLQGEVVETMLQALAEGRFPQFRYLPKNTRVENRVAISSVNFLPTAESFDSCRRGLLSYSRNSLHGRYVLFRRGMSDLNPHMRRLLLQAIQYVHESGSQTRIELVSGTEGFSVKTGRMRHNERVDSVRDFLTENGLDPSRILILNSKDDAITPPGSIRLQLAGPEPFEYIYFHAGSKALSQRDRKKLDFMLQYMRYMPLQGTVVLNGHSDSQGPRQVNLQISRLRVEAIRKYLIAQGLDQARIKTHAYGESKPMSTNRFPSGRELNRRVAIRIVG